MNFNNSNPQNSNEDDYQIVFVKSYKHWRTGKIIRKPDGSCFTLKIKIKKD